jgi:glycerol-3-phosphate acyltransferase PlsY
METIMEILGVAFAAFLIGSFPTAYILVRLRSGKEGSGNIGTLNAYEVSRSRLLGILTLLVDALKGALPIAVIHLIPDTGFSEGESLALASAALLGAVVGHNYSPWIGWKGGRGLATAAGAALLINPLLVGIWGTLWLAGFLKSKRVHFGNIAATVLLPFTVLIADDTVGVVTLFPHSNGSGVLLMTFLLSILVLLKHIEPLKQLMKKNTSS